MEDLLVWLEQSALARALKTSFVVYPLVNAAHIAAIGTLFAGVLMFSIRATEYAAISVFLAKMALIALAGLNFLLFIRIAARDPDAPALQGLAVLSILLWAAVLVCGRFIGFV